MASSVVAPAKGTFFRPCIDLHDGVVKQIVGSSLHDGDSSSLKTNFVATKPSADFARMYAEDGLRGGHIISLGGSSNKEAALSALAAYPGGMQYGGGITPENAREYLEAGASHVIVTSYVFAGGSISWERLDRLVDAVGKERLVLDLSCRKRPRSEAGSSAGPSEVAASMASATAATAEGPSSSVADSSSTAGPSSADLSPDAYLVVTDRWQRFTDYAITRDNLRKLSGYCDEFLVHGVDVEGMRMGVQEELVSLLAEWSPIPVTYAGGVRDLEDLQRVHNLGKGRVHVSVGSALDIFGGSLSYREVVDWAKGLTE